MLDVKGIPMQKQFYDIKFMVLVIASSYVIANSSVSANFFCEITQLRYVFIINT
jgi:hypothetical protein